MGRREKWPEKVGRREKAGRKCREEGENRMLWEKGDIDEKVILFSFLSCVITRDGDGKIDVHCA